MLSLLYAPSPHFVLYVPTTIRNYAIIFRCIIPVVF